MSEKTVLCAVDVSNKNRDINVLKMAARLADLDDAQLDVITVVPDYGMSVVDTYFDADHHAKAVTEAKRLLKETTALQQVLIDMKLHLEDESV